MGRSLDTRGEIDGTQVSSLGVRTVNVSAPAPQHEILGDLGRTEQQSPFHGTLSPTGAAALRPDVGDRETLVNLAKASGDAYSPGPNPDGWYDIDGVNWVSVLLGVHSNDACNADSTNNVQSSQTVRFGWRPGQDGLRGHLFMSMDKQHGIIVFKGTTVLAEIFVQRHIKEITHF